MPRHYTKPWLSVPDQIAKLRSYGLIIRNQPIAEQFLRHINYYRLSGYALAFESTRHVFIPGTTFEQVREAYKFDRTLRDLLNESLEIIELDIRTAVAHTFAEKHGPFGHTQAAKFIRFFGSPKRKLTHADWLSKLQKEVTRSSNLFVDHFERNYYEYPDLPIWEATEIMSFGSLSQMYSSMLIDDQKRVSARYKLQPKTLASWIHHLAHVRNLCAHHARLWDCQWTIKPELPVGKNWAAPLLPDNGHLFASLLIQLALLRCCDAEQTFTNGWRLRIETLIKNNIPTSPTAMNLMGLTADWNIHPLWK